MSAASQSTTRSESNSAHLEDLNLYYYDAPKTSEGETIAKKPTFWRKVVSWIRPGYLIDHLDYPSLRQVLPTFLQVWVTVVLSVVPRTSAWIGNATYLMQILGFICPVGGFSVCINVILAISCFSAMVIGWLFTVVALAIATAIRGWPTDQDIVDELIREGKCTQENASSCMVGQFFTGRYLDARATVVFAISLVLGITCFGIFSRIHKMARLVFVTGCISIIINTCYSVFFPIFIPLEVGLSIIKPAGIAFALKIILACSIFPFTSNFKYFDVASRILATLIDVSSRNESFFSTMKPSEDSFANYQGLMKDIQDTRVKLSAIDVFLASSRYEVSYGRFTSRDAHEFSSRIKALLNTYSGYEYFYVSMQERKEILKEVFYPKTRRGSLSNTNNSGQSKLFAAFSHTYREVGKFEDSKVQQLFKKKYLDDTKRDLTTLKDLDIVTDHIKDAHACYLGQMSDALKVARDWLADANEFRIYRVFNSKQWAEKQKQRHAEVVAARKNLKDFMKVHQEAQNELSVKMLEGMEGHEQILSLISQTSLFLFLSKQVAFQLLALFDFFLKIDEKRPKPVVNWPWNETEDPNTVDDQVGGENPLNPKAHPRDPDSLTPQTPLQLLMWGISKIYSTLLKENYSYWVHCAILVNFCAFPFYFKHSAHFFYSWKLTWFPVMCAVSTSQYSADSVYMFSTKVVYTFIGAVVGMVAWYISTGSGNGNYYGYSVVCAVVYFCASFYRHFSIHALPVAGIMVCITPTLVLGTSWVDSQYHLSDVGVGWRVAAVRCVSVIAGLSVAFSTTFFPRVRSSKAAFRKKLASTIESLNGIQNQVCNFALQRYDDPDVHIRIIDDKLSNEIRALLLKLAGIKGTMKSIQYETPLTGDWPIEKYEKLHKLIVSITQLYFLHYRLLDQVNDTDAWIPHMVNRAAWNQQEFLSSLVSLTYMASESLRLKIEMPEITTATLSIKHLEVLSEMWGTQGVSLNERVYTKRKDSQSSQIRRRALQKLDFENLLSPDGRLNVVALLITHMIYKQIDEAVLVVKGLVGEKYNYDMRLFEF
ncbi:hypothetical protein JCM33374_g1847 [Metschnikowia sp. JCM 33374]|nr:hypothetical protein JCM33374_g1847 [Metschnikowia sp. JCM 33374]